MKWKVFFTGLRTRVKKMTLNLVYCLGGVKTES